MNDKVATPEELSRLAYAASIRLLARRDHSVTELTRKLKDREHSDEAIATAIEELIDLNYVNEERYAELYVEQRMNRGYGPLSIKAKLRERGIADHLSQAALKQLQVNWADKAEQLIHKRFNRAEIGDTDQRAVAKIARFVQARGYAPSDTIRGLHQARRNS